MENVLSKRLDSLEARVFEIECWGKDTRIEITSHAKRILEIEEHLGLPVPLLLGSVEKPPGIGTSLTAGLAEGTPILSEEDLRLPAPAPALIVEVTPGERDGATQGASEQK